MGALRLRLTGQDASGRSQRTKTHPPCFGTEFDKTFALRLQEADESFIAP